MGSCTQTPRSLTPLRLGLHWRARFVYLSHLYTQRGAQTHDSEITRCTLFRLSQPGAPNSHSVLLPHRWWLARSLPGSPTLYIFETRLPPFSSPDRSRWKGWDTRLPDPTMPTSCAHAGEQRLCSRIVLDAAHLCPFRVPLGAGSPPGSIPGQPAAVPARGNERRASLPAMGFSHFTSHSNSPNSRPSTEPPLTSRATLQTSAESGGKIKIRLM
ncbi:uncharacterized protein LOC123790901 [Ursus americanus]|uniref:uncharacterized protein LOC123790901 n=1 Tax=Ursus americanus TaxID=9643 RepID=UPI001E67BCFD|nr:uncharacterized protein LOC123790901 [Ursus americanus]